MLKSAQKKKRKKNEKKEQAKNTGAIYGGDKFTVEILGVNQEVPMQISMMQQSPIASSQKARWWCMD